MHKLDLTLYSWILRGSQRREIIKVMNDLKIPAQIFREAQQHNPKITRNSVSDVLRSFQEKSIARCLNPEEKKGRLYQLTANGQLIRNEILNSSPILPPQGNKLEEAEEFS